jgi:hypothetical protein
MMREHLDKFGILEEAFAETLWYVNSDKLLSGRIRGTTTKAICFPRSWCGDSYRFYSWPRKTLHQLYVVSTRTKPLRYRSFLVHPLDIRNAEDQLLKRIKQWRRVEELLRELEHKCCSIAMNAWDK